MENNLIQWPKAVYWSTQFNPVAGCSPCSPACANCYAKALANRFKISFEPHKTTRQRPPRNGICFCGNFTDLFLDDVMDGLNGLPKTIDIIKSTLDKPTHATYLWLTKRADNMRVALDLLPDPSWLPNHYWGFTAENQECYDERAHDVQFFPGWAWQTWLSAEPLLGPITLNGDVNLNWCVVGAESGSHRRPCKIEWIESIVEQCKQYRIPVFVKQICLPSGKLTNRIEEFPKHLQIRQVPWADKDRRK